MSGLGFRTSGALTAVLSATRSPFTTLATPSPAATLAKRRAFREGELGPLQLDPLGLLGFGLDGIDVGLGFLSPFFRLGPRLVPLFLR
ncbi:MAG: hypothetical protein ACK56I_17080, partial [bacterium]